MDTSNINLLSNNITYIKSLSNKSDKFYSSKLLNYVEFIEIAGVRKTVVYSEINTNINVGDKVFIVNGNYDSLDFILKDKYNRSTDGYIVLGVDGCRILLDIDYTGVLPFNNIEIDSFIKVNHIESQREFEYANSINISSLGFGVISKFFGNISGVTASLYTNDILYCGASFSGISGLYSGVSTPGFYVRDDNSLPKTWINITSALLTNNITSSNVDFVNNSKLYVIGEDITYNNVVYKQRLAYKYHNSKWVIDTSYKEAMISKLNFRHGTFNGKHNDGIFGSNLKSNSWNNATWNSGIFLNSTWNSGVMSSKSIPGEQSYYSKIDGSSQSSPIQTVDLSNNRGFGYNFIIDSNLNKGILRNGNFENCNIGYTSTFSSIDLYYGLSFSHSLVISGGEYVLCDIDSVKSSNSVISNSNVRNSNIDSSEMVNSHIYQSTSYKSKFNSNSGIKVLSADIWSYDDNPGSIMSTTSSSIKGVLKLFISNDDIIKLDIGDSFYISKINKDYIITSLDNQQKVKLPIETRFILDTYFDSELTNSRISVSLKNANDNKYKSLVTRSSAVTTNSSILNSFPSASIDIECNGFGWYYNDTLSNYTTSYDVNKVIYLSTYVLSPITVTNVSKIFTDTFLYDSDFRSGIFDNSNWISGCNINYNQNIIKRIVTDNSRFDISYLSSSNSLRVRLDYNPMNQSMQINNEDTFVGDSVWINSIDYLYSTGSISLDGRYIVSNVSYFTSSTPKFVQLTLQPTDNQSVILQIASHSGGYYTIEGVENNKYASINKFMINNSTINSGLFKRTGVINSNFTNILFNNTDKDLSVSNVEQLRILNILFKDTNNIVNSGIVYKSHFVNDKWNNGILFNSIWSGGTFNNGLFKSSYWLDGTFNNGQFGDSGVTSSTVLDFDYVSRSQIWSGGTFNLGEFYNSVWYGGTFNNGRFYKSHWYGGIWNNGVLGSSKFNAYDTTLSYYNPSSIGATYTIWNNGVVENAVVGGNGVVYWYDGKFNNGEFTSFGTSSVNQSIWYNGDFNGGKFTELSKWKNGNFNKGKFLSSYGWDNLSSINPSTYSIDYGWENGKFNGGEFGNAGYATNSVWYNGEFNDGIFQGRLWNNGIFNNGRFIGSGLTSSTINSFVQSFTSSYYGLWNDGWVIDRKNIVQTNERIFTDLIRRVEEKPIVNSAYLYNVLWMGGTFSHSGGEMRDSVWLDGSFNKGSFVNSYFNPYVDRTLTATSSFTFNLNDTCVWNNGLFNGGKFYISEWKNGSFTSGEMIGGIWRDGVWYYGNANNVYWESGIWRNGIWNGSPFVTGTQSGTSSIITSYELNPGFEHDIIINVAKASGTSSMHLINAFSATFSNQYLPDVDLDNGFATASTVGMARSLYSNSGLSGANWETAISYNDYRVRSGVGFTTVIANFDNTVTVMSPSSLSSDPILLYCDASIYGGTGMTTSVLNKPSIFSSYPSDTVFYDITIELVVEANEYIIPSIIDNTVTVNISFGSLPVVSEKLDIIPFTTFSGDVYYYATHKTINISVPESGLTSRTVTITKVSGNGRLHILSTSLKARVSAYDPINNTLYPSMPSSPTFSSVISFPSNLSLSVISDTYVVPLTFGNGKFKSGVWENGVWNNGWRDDDYSKPFILSSSVKLNDNIWSVTLYALGDNAITNLSLFNIGDKVSIGNIITIDVNGHRRLIKDYFRITGKSGFSITCQIPVSFPARSITIDTLDNSPYTNGYVVDNADKSTHINYVTKNIWMSGVFLNGYFSGVWNYGLVKGRPFLTKLENVQWIDGEFNGGHIKGYTSSISYSNISTLDQVRGLVENNFNVDTFYSNLYYNQSLVQNMRFHDNNIANPYKFTFNTWLDVNYTSETQTNIYQDTNYYSTLNGVDTILSKPNLNGFITRDVLSSDSYFRNGYNRNVTNYSLGMKYTKYVDYLGGIGSFDNLFSKSISSLGLDNFESDGWNIVSVANGSTNSSVAFGITIFPGSYTLENVDNTLKLISPTTSIPGNSWPSTGMQNYIILNNENTKQIPNKRYSMFEYEILSWTGWAGPDAFSTRSYANDGSFYPPAINSVIYPATWSLSQMVPNPLHTSNPVKREYFYNRHSLLMQFVAGRVSLGQVYPLDLQMDNIHFYEVDMIPFFQYTTASNINMNIQAPYYVINVPQIDYSNSNYNFINNVTITITATKILPKIDMSKISVLNDVSFKPMSL